MQISCFLPQGFAVDLLCSGRSEAAQEGHQNAKANDGDPLPKDLVARAACETGVVHLVDQAGGNVSDDSGDAISDVPAQLFTLHRSAALRK